MSVTDLNTLARMAALRPLRSVKAPEMDWGDS